MAIAMPCALSAFDEFGPEDEHRTVSRHSNLIEPGCREIPKRRQVCATWRCVDSFRHDPEAPIGQSDLREGR